MNHIIKSLTAEIQTAVHESINTSLHKFINQVYQKVQSGKHLSADQIRDLWINREVDQLHKCIHLYKKGAKKGDSCGEDVSDKSISHKYCLKHYKSGESETSHSEAKSQTCVYKKTKGNDNGSECGLRASSKSKTHTYCSRHLAEENKVFYVDKVRLIQTIMKGCADSSDDDVKSVFELVIVQFGYMALYNLENLAPQIYLNNKVLIDEIIQREISQYVDVVVSIGVKNTGKSVVTGKVASSYITPIDSDTEDNSSTEFVKATKYKTGPYRGEYYICDSVSGNKYIIDAETKIVTSKIVDDAKVILTIEDCNIVRDRFQLSTTHV